jgi:pimeloyl-ACP methyl ester carboxylesterase
MRGAASCVVVISGNLPGGRTAVVQPAWARIMYGDLPMWALKVFAPHTMTYLAGVPRTYPLRGDDARFVSEFIDSMFPIAWKVEGVVFDAFVSNADVNRYDLEAISVPALLVHAKDDPLASYDSAVRAARRIPDARLVSLESGGHLMVGRAENFRNELARFFAHRVAA